MDILRKELNGIYASQRLGLERLPSALLDVALAQAETLARVGGGCSVITDAARDRCHIFAGGFGRLMGFAPAGFSRRMTDSSDEDEIYLRLHPEDLVEKRMLEYEFFRLADALSPSLKTSWKAVCRLRMRDGAGEWRTVDNSTQVITLSPAGKIWLILCCYDLSPGERAEEGIAPRLVNNATGEIRALSFGERRRRVLTEREKEVLRLIQAGRPSKQIAEALGISVHTVSRHRQNIIAKLSVGNSVEAVMAALSMKLL